MRASEISESTEWLTHEQLAQRIYRQLLTQTKPGTGSQYTKIEARQFAMDFYHLEDDFVSQDDLQSTGLAGFDVDPFEEDKARVNKIFKTRMLPFRVLAMKHDDEYNTLYSIVAPAPQMAESMRLDERVGWKYITDLLVKLFGMLGLRKFILWLVTFLFTTAAGLTLSLVLGLVAFIVSQVLNIITKGTVAGSKKLYQMLKDKLTDDDMEKLALAIEQELNNQPEPDEEELKAIANTTEPSPKEILDIVKTEQPELVTEKFGDAPHPTDFPGYSDVPRLDQLPFYYDALEDTLNWAKARNVSAKGEGFIKQFQKNLNIRYKKYINSARGWTDSARRRDRLKEAESVYVIVRKKDGKLLQKSSSKRELEKEFNASPGYSTKHHYIKRMIDPQQAKAERDPTHIGEADIRAFPTPEDYPIAKMDKLLRRYGVDYGMFINKPFDIKLYELLIDIYMNWEGSRIERGALFYMADQYRNRGVRAGELPPSKTTESVQRVDEAVPVALAAAGLWALRIGSVLRPAIRVGKWLWKNPGKTTAISVGADVTLNDGQDTKEVIDMVVDIKNDIVGPEEKKTIIKQIVEFVKANPGKSAVGFLVAFIAGAYALRAWFNKNDQYKEEDVNKVLSYQKKVLDKNPVQA